MSWSGAPASVPVDWLADTGFPDERGFLLVEDSLAGGGRKRRVCRRRCRRAENHPTAPRRGCTPCARRRCWPTTSLAAGHAPWLNKPQHRFLSLLSLGDRQAVADKGPFYASGAWAWRWKDRIDRASWASSASPPPAMAAPRRLHGSALRLCAPSCRQRYCARPWSNVAAFPTGHGVAEANCATMRRCCTGPPTSWCRPSIPCAALVDDPWLMGRITALHALSDLYAMGALRTRPRSCLPALRLPELQRASWSN